MLNKVSEDDIQVVYEDENGARITSLKNNRHHSLCMCDKCIQPERSKREDTPKGDAVL